MLEPEATNESKRSEMSLAATAAAIALRRDRKLPAPVSAYMLADHLDAALAAGEDLVAISYTPDNDDPLITTDTIMAARAAQRTVVERIRGLELSLIARILKGRERAVELARSDSRFRMVAKLFTGGTTPIADAVAEVTDATLNDFDTADAAPAYLRSRGLLPADTYALSERDQIMVDETFLVASRIELGPLLDMVATFIDALELHFDLYQGEEDDGTVDSDPAAIASEGPEAAPVEPDSTAPLAAAVRQTEAAAAVAENNDAESAADLADLSDVAASPEAETAMTDGTDATADALSAEVVSSLGEAHDVASPAEESPAIEASGAVSAQPESANVARPAATRRRSAMKRVDRVVRNLGLETNAVA